jgi:two-component system, OmpR family, alkaline phosphatase synthesis response regulator PhoP
MSTKQTILIVDDDESFAESNKDLLEAYGYDVILAPDGRQGLELARARRPDLMILDMMMTTDTEGLDVARRVAEIPELQAMKVLLVTGVAKALHLPRAPEPDRAWLPVSGVLEKPIAPNRLVKEIQKLLAQ